MIGASSADPSSGGVNSDSDDQSLDPKDAKQNRPLMHLPASDLELSNGEVPAAEDNFLSSELIATVPVWDAHRPQRQKLRLRRKVKTSSESLARVAPSVSDQSFPGIYRSRLGESVKFVRSHFKAGRYGRFFKWSAAILAILFILNGLLIGFAVYRMSLLRFDDILVDTFWVTGVSSGVASVAVKASIPKTILSEWFKVWVLDTLVEISVPQSGDALDVESERIATIMVPDLIVGRGGHEMDMNSVLVQLNTSTSLNSLLYFMSATDASKHVRVSCTTRIKTYSLGIPCDFRLKRAETVDLAKLLDENKRLLEDLAADMGKIELTSVRLDPSEADGQMAMTVAMTLPKAVILDFIKLEVPELHFGLEYSRADRVYPFAKVGLDRCVLSGHLLDYNNRISAIVELASKDAETLMMLLEMIRDGTPQGRITVRGLSGDDSGSVLQAWLQTFSWSVDIDAFVSTIPKDFFGENFTVNPVAAYAHAKKFLFKRDLAAMKHFRQPLERSLFGIRSRMEEAVKDDTRLIRLKLDCLKLRKDGNLAAVFSVSVVRKLLARCLGSDLGRFEGRLPDVAFSIGVEKVLGRSRKISTDHIVKVRIRHKEVSPRGNRDLALELVLILRKPKIFWTLVNAALLSGCSLQRLAPIKFFLSGSKSTFASNILRVFNVEYTVGRFRSTLRLRNAKTKALQRWLLDDLKIGRALRHFLRIRSRRLPKMKHHMLTSIDSDALSCTFNGGIRFSPDNFLKTWPSAEISWNDVSLKLHQCRGKGRTKGRPLLYIGIPANSFCVSLAHAPIPSLLHSGQLQVQAIVKESRRRMGKRGKHTSSILGRMRSFARSYMNGTLKGGRLLIKLKSSSPDDEYVKAASMTVRLSSWHQLGSFRLPAGADEVLGRFGFQSQLSLAGLSGSVLQFVLKLPQRLPGIQFPSSLRNIEVVAEFVFPRIQSSVCFQSLSKTGTFCNPSTLSLPFLAHRYCPVIAGTPAGSMRVRIRHGRPIQILTSYRPECTKDVGWDSRGQRIPSKPSPRLALFARLNPLSEVSGLLQHVIREGIENVGLSFGSSFVLAKKPHSLFDSIIHLVGLAVRLPLPASVLLGQFQRHVKLAKSARISRRETLQVAMSLKTPSPDKVALNLAVGAPKGSLQSRVSSRERLGPKRRIILKWKAVKMAISTKALGATLSVNGGQIEFRLDGLGIAPPSHSSFSGSKRGALKVALEIERKPGFLLDSYSVQEFLDAVLVYLDAGTNALNASQARRRCIRSHACRHSLRRSPLVAFAWKTLPEIEVAFQTGQLPDWKVCRLKYFLGLARVLWALVCSQRALSVLQPFFRKHATALERHLDCLIKLFPHPDAAKIVKVPCLLPSLCPPSTWGKVAHGKDLPGLGIDVVLGHRLFDHAGQMLSPILGQAMSLVGLPVYPGRMALRLSLPALRVTAGMNGIDLAILDSKPLTVTRFLPITYGGAVLPLSEHQRGADMKLTVLATFPGAMEEFPMLLHPFTFDARLSLAADPIPDLLLGKRKLRPNQSPLTVTVGTARLGQHSGGLLASLLTGLIRDMPFLCVAAHIDPFAYKAALVGTSGDELCVRLEGLRVFLPLRGKVRIDLGQDLTVVVVYRGVPFVQMRFGPHVRWLHPGTNQLPCTVVLSKSAFGMRRDAGELARLLNRMVSEVAAHDDPVDFTFLFRLSDGTVLLEMPFRLPPRARPELDRLLVQIMDADGEGTGLDVRCADMDSMMADGLAAARALGADFMADLGRAGRRKAQEFTSWATGLPTAAQDSAGTPHAPAPAMMPPLAIRLPIAFPWETDVLGYDVRLSFDKSLGLASRLLGHALGDSVSQSPAYRVQSEGYDDPFAPLEPVVRLAPGKPLTLRRGLLGTKDVPSASFALQLADSMYYGPGVCAAATVRVRVRLRVPREETAAGLVDDEFLLDVTVALAGLPVPSAWHADPCVRWGRCIPVQRGTVSHQHRLPRLVGVAMDSRDAVMRVYGEGAEYVEPVQFNPHYGFNMVSDTQRRSLVMLTRPYDPTVPSCVSFVVDYDGSPWACVLSVVWSASRELAEIMRAGPGTVSLEVRPGVGSVRLTAGGLGDEPLFDLPAGRGGFPFNAPAGAYRFSVLIRPFGPGDGEGDLVLVVESVAKPHLHRSSVRIPVEPVGVLGRRPLAAGLLQQGGRSKTTTRVARFSVAPLQPDFGLTRVFFVGQEAARLFEPYRLAIQLRDSCDRPHGRHAPGLRVRLQRVRERPAWNPWPARPGACQFYTLLGKPSWGDAEFRDDAALDGDGDASPTVDCPVRFVPASGLYVATCRVCGLPGRYRIFLADGCRVEPGDVAPILADRSLPPYSRRPANVWVLAPRSHVYVRDVV